MLVRPKGPPNFLKLVGMLVFVFAISGLGILYGYRSLVIAQNNDKKNVVEKAIRDFEPELTKELTIIKARLDAGKYLVDNHKAVSLLFSLLELNTAQTVRFNEFSYVTNSDNTITVSLKGEARSYNAIAYQSDVFSKIESINNPVFGNLAIDEKGVISFSVTAGLDPSAVMYKKLVQISEIAPPSPSAVVDKSVATSTPVTDTNGSATGTISII